MTQSRRTCSLQSFFFPTFRFKSRRPWGPPLDPRCCNFPRDLRRSETKRRAEGYGAGSPHCVSQQMRHLRACICTGTTVNVIPFMWYHSQWEWWKIIAFANKFSWFNVVNPTNKPFYQRGRRRSPRCPPRSVRRSPQSGPVQAFFWAYFMHFFWGYFMQFYIVTSPKIEQQNTKSCFFWFVFFLSLSLLLPLFICQGVVYLHLDMHFIITSIHTIHACMHT